MSLLQTAQNSWQNKVGEKDVDKFTVAGKMGGSSTPNKRPSRKESEMNAVNESHQQTVNIWCFEFLFTWYTMYTQLYLLIRNGAKYH